MMNREWLSLSLSMLSAVLFLSGAAALAMLPRVSNIFVGIGLFVAAVILGFVALEFLPQDKERIGNEG